MLDDEFRSGVRARGGDPCPGVRPELDPAASPGNGLEILEAERLCRAADVAGAMSLEALKGSSRPFDTRLQAARPHPGQAVVAGNLRSLLADSEIAESHRDCGKVQDAYSLRCMPQVHGATRDALAWVRGIREIRVRHREFLAQLDAGGVMAESEADDVHVFRTGCPPK